MGKWILKFVHLFDKIFIRQGIDLNQLYTIVDVKMMMDKRRVYMNWKQTAQTEDRDHLALVLGGYLLFGAVVAIIVFGLPSFITAMIFAHSYVIFMISITLITDFSTILLDTTDNQIILPKPVNSRTLFMARQIHIVSYLFQFSTALSILPVVAIAIKYGIVTAIASVLTITLSVLLAISITYFFYLLILKFSSESKIKEIVTGLQIAITIFFVAGYQVMTRFAVVMEAANNFQLHWYSYFLPPVWMALTLEAVHELKFDMQHVVMIVLTLSIPLLLFWFLNKYLAPVFSSRLSALNTDVQSGEIGERNVVQKKSISDNISGLLTKSPSYKAMFQVVWKITSRDKNFKLQLYPLLGYTVVFLLFFVVLDGRKHGVSLEQISSSTKYLWLIYFPMLMITNAIIFVAFNENFSASWIYHVSPLQKPGELLLASVDSLFIKYFLPIFILMFGLGAYIWKATIIDDYIFGLSNTYFALLVAVLLMDKYLPFSRQPNTKQQSGRGILVLLQMVIIAALVGFHYLLGKISGLLYILFVVEVSLCWLIRRDIRNLPWKKISV